MWFWATRIPYHRAKTIKNHPFREWYGMIHGYTTHKNGDLGMLDYFIQMILFITTGGDISARTPRRERFDLFQLERVSRSCGLK